jgi:hypothetical protein
MFKAAWLASFTEKNIHSAFAKTGIFPYKPAMVLDKIQRLEPLPVSNSHESTPMTCRAVRRVHKAYQKSPTAQRLTIIFHANIRLATQHSIDQHTITGLMGALKEEKKKRSRGKRLNLVGEEDSGPQFYSPSRVHRAKTFADERKAEEQVEQDRIATKKATAIANRLRKEEEKAARALQASIRKQEAAEKKLQKAAEVQAQKDQRQVAKQAREAQLLARRASKAAPKSKEATIVRRQSTVVAKVDGGFAKVKVVTSRGRTTMRPTQWSS